MYGHFVVAVLWNGCVAVALRRYFVAVYCGAVVLVCILHSGVLAVFMFLRNSILATFYIFEQWYSCLCFYTMVF